MNKILKLLKNSCKEHLSIYGTVVVIIGILTTLSNFTKSDIFSELNIIIICITAFAIIRNVTQKIFLAKKESFGVSTNEFSDKTIKRSKSLRSISFVFLLIPLCFFAANINDYLKLKKSQELYCKESVGKINILIANFRLNDDDFSSALYGKLDSYLQDVDSINVRQLNKFIPFSNKIYIDTAAKAFQDNCCDTGLLAFGKRGDSNMLNCRIYSKNLLNLRSKNFHNENKTLIYIINPDVLDFSIENESNIVYKFILGLIYYHNKNYDESNKLFAGALNNKKINKENKRFISLCHLFIGDNFLMTNQPLKAIEEYGKGLLDDSTNSYLHYNLGIVSNKIGNLEVAKSEFKTAQKLNKNLKNPLANDSLINKIAKVITPVSLGEESTTTSIPILKQEILKKKEENWIENISIVLHNKKYGVIYGQKDTIISCRYDNINQYSYKNVDYFIVQFGNRFGAVFHKHLNDGFSIFRIAPKFSQDSIKTKAINWIDMNGESLTFQQ